MSATLTTGAFIKSLNRIELIGHVGADPEIRTTKGDTRVASLTLATNRKSRGEEVTDWHRLTFWDQLAGLVEKYVRKGDPLWVEGRVRYSTSEEDGEQRFWTEIVVSQVIFVLAPAFFDSWPTEKRQAVTEYFMKTLFSDDLAEHDERLGLFWRIGQQGPDPTAISDGA